MRNLVAEFDLSMLFVTHDFGVVAQLCDEVSGSMPARPSRAAPTRRSIDEAAYPRARLPWPEHPDRAIDLGGIPAACRARLRRREAPPLPSALPDRCRGARRRAAHHRADVERHDVACPRYWLLQRRCAVP